MQGTQKALEAEGHGFPQQGRRAVGGLSDQRDRVVGRKKRRGAGLGLRVGGGGLRGVRNEWGEGVPRGHVKLNSNPSDSDRSEIQLDKTDLPAPVWGRGPGTMGGAHPVPPVTVDI